MAEQCVAGYAPQVARPQNADVGAKRMNIICVTITCILLACLAALAEQPYSVAIVELQDSAIVATPDIWQNNFKSYIQVQQIYVCSITALLDDKGQYKLLITRSIRGETTGSILCRLPGGTHDDFAIGARIIILGNFHKTGFNVMGWWKYSKSIEAQIEQAIGRGEKFEPQQSGPGYPPQGVGSPDP